jgi:beta-fructofuranosidase
MTLKSLIHLPHPTRFVWDFWYHKDAGEDVFHILFLNAEKDLAQKDQHHFHSVVGYARTRDFERIQWIDDFVFTPDPDGWDNTSIWTGDVVRTGNGYLLFYTSRDGTGITGGDFFTQHVGMAFSEDFTRWERIPDSRLSPDPRHYETAHVEGDTTIQAWRDPFVFQNRDGIYMLIAAKTGEYAPGRKGAAGLLRAASPSLTRWEAMPPLYAPGRYSQVEVPQVYLDGEDNLRLVFSMTAVDDLWDVTGGAGGFHAVTLPDISPRRISEHYKIEPEVLLPYDSGLYACRIIPELDGLIVGFHQKEGGLVNSRIKTGWRSVGREFSQIVIKR